MKKIISQGLVLLLIANCAHKKVENGQDGAGQLQATQTRNLITPPKLEIQDQKQAQNKDKKTSQLPHQSNSRKIANVGVGEEVDLSSYFKKYENSSSMQSIFSASTNTLDLVFLSKLANKFYKEKFLNSNSKNSEENAQGDSYFKDYAGSKVTGFLRFYKKNDTTVTQSSIESEMENVIQQFETQMNEEQSNSALESILALKNGEDFISIMLGTDMYQRQLVSLNAGLPVTVYSYLAKFMAARHLSIDSSRFTLGNTFYEPLLPAFYSMGSKLTYREAGLTKTVAYIYPSSALPFGLVVTDKTMKGYVRKAKTNQTTLRGTSSRTSEEKRLFKAWMFQAFSMGGSTISSFCSKCGATYQTQFNKFYSSVKTSLSNYYNLGSLVASNNCTVDASGTDYPLWSALSTISSGGYTSSSVCDDISSGDFSSLCCSTDTVTDSFTPCIQSCSCPYETSYTTNVDYDRYYIKGVPVIYQQTGDFGCTLGESSVGCGPAAASSLLYWWSQRGFGDYTSSSTLYSSGLHQWKEMNEKMNDKLNAWCVPFSGNPESSATTSTDLQEGLNNWFDSKSINLYADLEKVKEGGGTGVLSEDEAWSRIKSSIKAGRPVLLMFCLLGQTDDTGWVTEEACDGSMGIDDVSTDWFNAHWGVITGYEDNGGSDRKIRVNYNFGDNSFNFGGEELLDFEVPEGKVSLVLTSIDGGGATDPEWCGGQPNMSSYYNPTWEDPDGDGWGTGINSSASELDPATDSTYSYYARYVGDECSTISKDDVNETVYYEAEDTRSCSSGGGGGGGTGPGIPVPGDFRLFPFDDDTSLVEGAEAMESSTSSP